MAILRCPVLSVQFSVQFTTVAILRCPVLSTVYTSLEGVDLILTLYPIILPLGVSGTSHFKFKKVMSILLTWILGGGDDTGTQMRGRRREEREKVRGEGGCKRGIWYIIEL